MAAVLSLLLFPGCFLLTEGDLAARLEGGRARADTATDSDADSDTDADVDADTDADADSDTDTGVTPDPTWYADSDGDGSGNPANAVKAAEQPEGYVANAWDCDDDLAAEPVWVTEGDSTGSNGTMAQPYPSVQAGLQAALKCVRIRAGVYNENVNTIGKNLDILGVDGASITKIVGTSQAPTLIVWGTEHVHLTGVTLSGGLGELSSESEPYYVGGGILLANSTLTLKDVTVSGNSASSGGGIISTDSTLDMVDVRIVGNTARDGAGIEQIGGTLTGSRVNLSGNTGDFASAMYIDGGATTFTNLIMNANRGSLAVDGIDARNAEITVSNATFVDEDTAIYAESSSLSVSGGIFTEVSYAAFLANPGAVSVTYSDAPDDAWAGFKIGTGKGNISDDPGLTLLNADGEWSDDDLHLGVGSACIDAGDPTGLDEDGSRLDIGAYAGTVDW